MVDTMMEAAMFVLGLAIGALIGIVMVWDRRFNEGRRYGYNQHLEMLEGRDALERIRQLM